MTPEARAAALFGECTCGTAAMVQETHPVRWHTYLCHRALGPSYEAIVEAIRAAERDVKAAEAA